jgi:DNA-binding NtrC family response regulator
VETVFDPRNSPILLLDEDENHLEASSNTLSELGYPVAVARTPEDALVLASERPFEFYLVSVPLRSRPVEGYLGTLHRDHPGVPIVLVTGSDGVERAVDFFAAGIEDYLLRPLDPREVRARLGRILERHDLGSHVSLLQDEIAKRLGLRSFVCRSPAMEAVVGRIDRIAPMRSTILIVGESGSGKELVARAVHYKGPRKNHPFVALNCAAIPESLIESELFGHEKGSFTGAFSRAPGKFEIAHHGTLFLDEIAEMKRETQAKLLRVLEEREFMRVGGSQTIRVDVRVIAATNADLERLVAEGRFRRDLYFRLKVLTISVPPLRERREDIPDLSAGFLEEICRANNLPPRRVSDDVLASFGRHPWPGNVRELKNVLESIVVGTVSEPIGLEDLPLAFRDGRGRRVAPPELRAGMTMRDMERELIRRTLEQTGGNRTHTARILDIGVRTLQRKIRAFGL